MQNANFLDEETGEQFYISKFKMVFKNGIWINIDTNGNQITNKANGNILKSIPQDGIPNFNKSNNKETLQKMLKKRSSEHFKKEIEEVKYEKNKQLNSND